MRLLVTVVCTLVIGLALDYVSARGGRRAAPQCCGFAHGGRSNEVWRRRGDQWRYRYRHSRKYQQAVPHRDVPAPVKPLPLPDPCACQAEPVCGCAPVVAQPPPPPPPPPPPAPVANPCECQAQPAPCGCARPQRVRRVRPVRQPRPRRVRPVRDPCARRPIRQQRNPCATQSISQQIEFQTGLNVPASSDQSTYVYAYESQPQVAVNTEPVNYVVSAQEGASPLISQSLEQPYLRSVAVTTGEAQSLNGAVGVQPIVYEGAYSGVYGDVAGMSVGTVEGVSVGAVEAVDSTVSGISQPLKSAIDAADAAATTVQQ